MDSELKPTSDITSIPGLLAEQSPTIRNLFVKALNLYATNTAAHLSAPQKADQLRKAIEQAVDVEQV